MSCRQNQVLFVFLFSFRAACSSPRHKLEERRRGEPTQFLSDTLKGKCTLNEEMGGGTGANVALFFFPGGRVAGHVTDRCTNPSPTAALPPLVRRSSADGNNCLENYLKTFQCHIYPPSVWRCFSSTMVPFNVSLCKMFRSKQQAGWGFASGGF